MDLNEKATVRFETMPGKQGQMDWGFFEDHLVYEDGKWKKLYCFLMILGYSRMRYIEFVTDMSTNTLIRCHQNAFRYFGGYPEEILYDNMKQVVIKRLLKQEDSTLNRQFEDFAGFYGFQPISWHAQILIRLNKEIQPVINTKSFRYDLPPDSALAGDFSTAKFFRKQKIKRRF